MSPSTERAEMVVRTLNVERRAFSVHDRLRRLTAVLALRCDEYLASRSLRAVSVEAEKLKGPICGRVDGANVNCNCSVAVG
jgi:hypothetical protein